ncbi:hypothetical protein tinsulaeT_02720 [Thalassotalea insulae]|uniref:Uncharacterized protein n=1 Tax=Thalassotalea insulae TaxID=2056778 RepID=A0ABQ6GLW7_9GAMM|nr:hypothetical protein [Thalassotalea insulae]GLX76932.1 hypothetical protein tinsulaeT_02720 [Thalassotalea insulae]
MANSQAIRKTTPHLLQKVAKIIAVISTLVAISCLIYATVFIDQQNDVMKASFGASAFFFFMIAIVLKVIADTNLPNLKISDNKEK